MDKGSLRFKSIKTYFNIIIISILVLLHLALVGLFLKSGIDNCNDYFVSYLSQEGFYPGIHINGIDMSTKTKEQAKCILIKTLTSAKPFNIKIDCEDNSVLVSSNEFVYDCKVDQTLNIAYSIAREGTLISRFVTAMLININPISLDVLKVPTEESINLVVNNIASKFDVGAEEPYVSCFNPLEDPPVFTYEAGENGFEVDKNELKVKVVEALKNKVESIIFIKRKEVKSTVSIENAKKKIGLISEFKTMVSSNYSRNNNIKIALSHINGTALKPGKSFSFNEIVGNTNLASRGFMLAPALLNGVLITAYGGGVCQVASTVYGAAIRANMAIMERHNHSIKSSYVPVGQDATVSYNFADLKFRNLHTKPVYICTYLKDHNVICRFYGTIPSWYDKIEIVSGYIEGSTNKAFAKRVFYKNGIEVYREALPSSIYK